MVSSFKAFSLEHTRIIYSIPNGMNMYVMNAVIMLS